jgi:hypothetical protein
VETVLTAAGVINVRRLLRLCDLLSTWFCRPTWNEVFPS